MDVPRAGAYRRSMTTRTGFTLIEIATVLVLCGTLVGIAVPSIARTADRLAVRSARSELASAVSVARSTAMAVGGATLVIDVPAARAWVEPVSGASPGTVLELGARYGVTLHGTRVERLALRFDGLGIGRMAGTTLQVRRGTASTSFVVSAYGRVRP
jgi:Tfp pilus assembly protein FimT